MLPPGDHGNRIPDEIVIWEVLVRLPPKPLRRCRAVCRGWRNATSARDFLLAHHGRQPSLPIVVNFYHSPSHQEFVPLDHRAGMPAADRLCAVARLGYGFFSVRASCDGLLLVSDVDTQYAICNPATHQYAPLPQIRNCAILGMYLHSPTGEYRLLLLMRDSDDIRACCVFTLGSCQPPRNIDIPWHGPELVPVPILFRGNLHWPEEQHESGSSNNIFTIDLELVKSHLISKIIPDILVLA
jgi:hypothetical protein